MPEQQGGVKWRHRQTPCSMRMQTLTFMQSCGLQHSRWVTCLLCFCKGSSGWQQEAAEANNQQTASPQTQHTPAACSCMCIQSVNRSAPSIVHSCAGIALQAAAQDMCCFMPLLHATTCIVVKVQAALNVCQLQGKACPDIHTATTTTSTPSHTGAGACRQSALPENKTVYFM